MDTSKTYKVKILKTTPFDVAGTELTLSEFRLKYGYICSNGVTDTQLIEYLKSYRSHPVLKQQADDCVTDWFLLLEIENLEPLHFIYEGMYYTKEFDGFYHVWGSPQQYNLFKQGDKNQRSVATLNIATVREMLTAAKYKQIIPYYTNSVHNKL